MIKYIKYMASPEQSPTPTSRSSSESERPSKKKLTAHNTSSREQSPPPARHPTEVPERKSPQQEGTIFSPKHDSSSSTLKPDVERSPNARRQDEVYERLGLGYIDPKPLADRQSPEMEKFSRETESAFLFTSENVADFINFLDLEGKSIAVIGGSADFTINAFMYGAKSVKPVDIVAVADHVGELKTAGVSEFDHTEFLDFFYPKDPKQFLLHNQYKKLRPNISKHAEHYFDKIIIENEDSLSNTDKIISFSDADIIRVNPYLQSPENYKKAQENLKPVIFDPLDIKKFLDQNKDKNYDHIYLSNILSYQPYYSRQDSLHNLDETTKLIQAANDALSTEGEVSIYYGNFDKDNLDNVKNLAHGITLDFNQNNTAGMKMEEEIICGKHHTYEDDPNSYFLVLILKK
jgi:hypothetical protein